MNVRPGFVVALGVAVVLLLLSRTRRGREVASDTLEFVTVTAQRISDALTPRGLRNNNPLNLRRTSIPWRGKVATPERAVELGMRWDPDYELFEHPAFGVRAAAKDIRNDYYRDGLRTVAKLIGEFAPSSDNNPTDVYAANVARAIGVDPDQPFELEQNIVAMFQAMILQENGRNPFTPAELAEWVNLP